LNSDTQHIYLNTFAVKSVIVALALPQNPERFLPNDEKNSEICLA
jgi:hypothetical protein